MKRKLFGVLLIFIIFFGCTTVDAKVSDKKNESFANIVLFAYFNGDIDGKDYLIKNYNTYKKYYEDNNVLSVKGYLKEISYDKFNLVNYFPQEKDGVIVPYELSITSDDLDTTNNDYTIIHEVINNLNIDGTVDYDGDGYVDNLTVILKGGSSSVSSNSTLVSHKGDYIENSDKINNKNIFHYNMLNTYSIDLQEAGVISHEFLHTLGYPDLYTSEDNNIPVYIWDIMGAVSYKMSYPLAYNRMYFSDWIDIDEITSSQTITLNSQDDADGNQAYILKSPFNEYELFVVEYRKSGYTSDVNVKKLDGMIYYPGVIVYRVNTTVEGLSNHYGNLGEYVFRTSSSSNDRSTIISEISHAALSSGGTDSYGSSDLSKTDNVISYSDGSNSGIVISNVKENDDGSVSLDVSIPEAKKYDLWNSINYNDTLGDINKYSDIAFFNNKLYMVNVGNNKIFTSNYSNNIWSSNIEQSITNTSNLYKTSLFEMNGNLYMILSFYDCVKLYKFSSEWELASTLNVSNNDVSYKVLNNELYLNLIDENSSNAYIYKYSNDTFIKQKNYYSGSYDIGSSNIESIGNNLYYFLRKANGDLLIYDSDYNSISNSLNSNTYDVINYKNKLYFVLGSDSNNEYLRMAFYDGNEFNLIDTNIKQGFPSLVVSEGNLYVIATDTSSSGKTIVYSYDDDTGKLDKEGENVDNGASTTNLNLISNSNKIYVLLKRITDDSFIIKVKDTSNELLSLSVVSPNKTTYYKGDNIDLTGLVVSANYTLSSKKITDYTISNFNTNNVGTFNAVINYEGKTTTFSYTVVNKIIDIDKPVLYKINVIKNNSSIKVSNESQENESVHFSATPNFGYKIKNITVVDSNNKTVKITNNTFSMPSSNVIIKVITDYKRIGDSQILKLTKSTYNSITISWEKIVDAKGYCIYRSTNGKKYTLYKTITNNKTTSFTNKSLKTGTKYYYKVRAYTIKSKKKIYSKYSNVINKKLTLNTPKLTGYNNKGSYAKITYTKVNGASGYYIYRLYGNKYKKIGTTTSLVYKDKTAKKNNTYTYKVKAYRKVGSKIVTSNLSNSVLSKKL